MYEYMYICHVCVMCMTHNWLSSSHTTSLVTESNPRLLSLTRYPSAGTARAERARQLPRHSCSWRALATRRDLSDTCQRCSLRWSMGHRALPLVLGRLSAATAASFLSRSFSSSAARFSSAARACRRVPAVISHPRRESKYYWST